MDESDPPQPPAKKGGFKGKRAKGRPLSRHKRKGSGNKKTTKEQPDQEEGPAAAIPSDAAPAPSRASKDLKHTTKEEYADMLASCEQELNAALSMIDQKDRLIDKLNSKINQLTGATKKSRSVAREAKQYAKNVSDQYERAHKKLKTDLSIAEQNLIQTQMDQDAEVDRVRSLEEDRRSRAVAVIEKQMQKKLKRQEKKLLSEKNAELKAIDTELKRQQKEKSLEYMSKEAEYKSAIKDMDSDLKVSWVSVFFFTSCYIYLSTFPKCISLQNVKDIAAARLNVTANMQIENLRLKQKAQLALDQKDILHRQAIAAQQKKAASLIQEKKRTILEQKNDLKNDLKDYQEFAHELSAEHEEIWKTSSKALKKAAAAEETATKRLHKNKDANATIQSLREQLD